MTNSGATDSGKDVPQLVRVVLVDDDSLMRAGLRMIIEQSDNIVVVGEAEDGSEALRLVRQERPDVVLMDVRMPGMNGIDATQALTSAGSAVRVIVLTTFEMEEYVFGALRAGASGFLLKRTKPEELLAGIQAVAEGDALLSPSVTRHLIEEFTAGPVARTEPDPRLAQLTRPGNRSARSDGGRTEQRRNSRGVVHCREHGEDTREAGVVQTRFTRSSPSRCGRLRRRANGRPLKAGLGSLIRVRSQRRHRRGPGRTDTQGLLGELVPPRRRGLRRSWRKTEPWWWSWPGSWLRLLWQSSR